MPCAREHCGRLTLWTWKLVDSQTRRPYVESGVWEIKQFRSGCWWLSVRSSVCFSCILLLWLFLRSCPVVGLCSLYFLFVIRNNVTLLLSLLALFLFTLFAFHVNDIVINWDWHLTKATLEFRSFVHPIVRSNAKQQQQQHHTITQTHITFTHWMGWFRDARLNRINCDVAERWATE